MKKKKEDINQVFMNMQTSDTYSLLCSFLYEMKNIPGYSPLSELCYMLDRDSFEKLLIYFEGKTVTFPTKEEFVDAVRMVKLYQYYEVEKRPWKDCVLLAGYESSSGKLAHNKLEKLKETLEKYNFGNRNY